MEANTGTNELFELLGKPGSNLIDTEWKSFAAKVVKFVYNEERKKSITNYKAIATGISESLNIPCVEIKNAIQGIGPLKTEGSQIGRFSVRMLDLLRTSRIYIVLNQSATNNEKTIAILHEIGHFVHHFELMQSISTLYLRICLNPSLEYKVGKFVNGEYGIRLKVLLEKEADLFALSCLNPLGLYKDLKNEDNIFNTQTQSINGYMFQVLRGLFSDLPTSTIDKANIIGQNKRGMETCNREQNQPYPLENSLIARIKWILFNRFSLLNQIPDERHQLFVNYFNIAGPPRYIPELTKKEYNCNNKLNNLQDRWINRVMPDQVYATLDLDNWEPILVTPSSNTLIPYHIPITPIPSVNPTDSQIKWQHMFKAESSLPMSIGDWLGRANKQKAGLLIFPRNPAEIILDQQFLIK